MQVSTLITMAMIMTIVWGGFAALVVVALRKERVKAADRGPRGE